jgi:sialic acid synthase SpsE
MDKTAFVAEVSSNHHQDLQRCLQFVDVAADIGCSAVKFQLFKIEELFAPEILNRSEEHRRRKDWELPVSFLPPLAERCRERKIKFACTPFYLEAVNELFPYVDFYKIASYELLWRDLLIKCAGTGKPIVLSTGMATLDEVNKAVDVLIDAGCQDLTLLHCISGYPTPVSGCNLAAIKTLREKICPPKSPIRIRVGWSDHSANPGVIYRALHRWQSEMIEFHLDLEGEGEEFASGHCWLPNTMRDVIQSAYQGFDADGNGKKEPTPGELQDRNWRSDPSDGLRPLKETRKTFTHE